MSPVGDHGEPDIEYGNTYKNILCFLHITNTSRNHGQLKFVLNLKSICEKAIFKNRTI